MLILQRLKEPSTYAAISAALAAIGYNVPNETIQAVTMAGVGLASLAGILLAERPARP